MTGASDSKVEATLLPAVKSPPGTQGASRRSYEADEARAGHGREDHQQEEEEVEGEEKRKE